MYQGQQTVAKPEHRRIVNHLDIILGMRRCPHQFEDADLRNGEAFGGTFDNQRRNDGQGQRNLNGKGRSLAFL